MINARVPSTRRSRGSIRAIATPLILAVLVVVALLGGIEPAGAAPAGTLDPTFGVQGAVLDPTFGAAAAVLPSGTRTYVGTESRATATASARPVVLALDAGGHLDPSFGTGGAVRFTDSFSPSGVSLEPAPGGGVFVARTGANGRIVTKLTTAGAPDPTFGGTGSVTAPLAHGAVTLAWSVEHADVGGITVGGIAITSAQIYVVLLRFGLDGAPVATFGNQGLAAFPIPVGLQLPMDLATDSAGRTIVVVADGFSFTTLLRFTANGVIDPTFGNGGVASPTREIKATRVAIDSVGRLLLLGTAEMLGTVTLDAIPVLARLSADGIPDTSYGNGGVVGLKRVNGLYASGQDLAIDGADRALFTFAVRTTANQLAGVARVDTTGALDPTFGFGTGAGVAAWPMRSPFLALGLDATGRAILGADLTSTDPACPPNCSNLLVLRVRGS